MSGNYRSMSEKEEKQAVTDETAATEETLEQQESAEEAATESEAVSEVEELRRQVEETKDKYLRLFADFDNYKRRSARESLETMQLASKELMIALLPVLDDFERAMKAASESDDPDALKQGVELVYNKLFRTLEQNGLAPMDAIGEEFDPNIHEALTEIPAPNDDMKGKVVDQVEKGYKMHEKIIRYAKVVVGK